MKFTTNKWGRLTHPDRPTRALIEWAGKR